MKKNPIATALFILGVLSIVGGIILGLVYGTEEPSYGYDQGTLGWSFVIYGVVWGVVLLGFSEIIKLLQGIYNQGAPEKERAEEHISTPPPDTDKGFAGNVSTAARSEIVNFYKKKGITVEGIEAMEKEYFYLVTAGGKQEIVELGGFKPIVHPS
ncbi:UNVERIFIED_CONTAM: hypothetical protein N8J90_16535 [Halobacillus marinus]